MTTKLPATEYPTLQKFVMKGITTKTAAREAMEELGELIDALQACKDNMDEAICAWEDGDDAETRAEGKSDLEGVVTDLDQPLSNAGYCAGQEPYNPPDV